jgi:hypothetical protein
MQSCISLIVIGALMVQGDLGWFNACLCTTPEKTRHCSFSKSVKPGVCRCCQNPQPAACDKEASPDCRCAKPSQPALQPVDKEFRRLPESSWIIPHEATSERGNRSIGLFSPISANSYRARSLQELYCVWRE